MLKMESGFMDVFNRCFHSFVLQSLIVSPVQFFVRHRAFFSLKSAEEENLHLPRNFINYTSEYWLMLKVTIITIRREIRVFWARLS